MITNKDNRPVLVSCPPHPMLTVLNVSPQAPRHDPTATIFKRVAQKKQRSSLAQERAGMNKELADLLDQSRPLVEALSGLDIKIHERGSWRPPSAPDLYFRSRESDLEHIYFCTSSDQVLNGVLSNLNSGGVSLGSQSMPILPSGVGGKSRRSYIQPHFHNEIFGETLDKRKPGFYLTGSFHSKVAKDDYNAFIPVSLAAAMGLLTRHIVPVLDQASAKEFAETQSADGRYCQAFKSAKQLEQLWQGSVSGKDPLLDRLVELVRKEDLAKESREALKSSITGRRKTQLDGRKEREQAHQEERIKNTRDGALGLG